jgi:hypothetical protein
MSIRKKYMAMMKVFRYQYGKGAKNTDELDELGKHYLGKKYMGTFAYDEYPLNAPNKTFAILNTDNNKGVHWVGLYKDGNKLYVYDSFARNVNNLLKKFTDSVEKLGYKVISSNVEGDQGNDQDDCGLRSLSWAILTNKFGIQNGNQI